jgi:hypothetical protein
MALSKLLTIIIFTVLFTHVYAQPHPDQVYVDTQGVKHWSADNKELYGFGVNYTLPFAHEFRMAKKTGISLEDAIRQDVYHMARLDLDLYRVHVWDTEISDTLGNLLNNEHLKLLDFTINEMKQRGMYFLITPIAYWGNGWPEKDEPTPGFSFKYGKGKCLTDPEAIKAQANYLYQFLNHINPYTGIAYKDEPRMIGFEICNEPHHSEPPETITAFINTMVTSMRKTGCTKPIFYNVTQNADQADAYLNANIQGATFQWYPTNLVANHQINGNFLPQVSQYQIPFASHPKFKAIAKIVYEFDPADVGGNIMYPAMARSFREAGMQLGAQFAYDAMCSAPYNTNYGTHFMNLAYAPHKAISLKIASAIFHQLPLYQKTPDKTQFDGFRISYPDDLAEWVTNEKFFYSNNTTSQPQDATQLKEIAGCGSSPMVKYKGTGAYFLDKLSDGIWRMEVMPDAYWVVDPYSPVNPNIQKAAVLHTTQQMTIAIPNLGSDFGVTPVNSGNTTVIQVSDSWFSIIPGVYILKRKNVSNQINTGQIYKNIRINEFVAPPSNLKTTVLWNHSPEEVLAGKAFKLQFEVVSTTPVTKVNVVMSNGDKWKTVMAVWHGTNSFMADVSEEMTENGFLHYRIIVEDQKDTITFPAEKRGEPWSWDKKDETTYPIRLVPQNTPLVIWNAEADWENSYKIWNRSVNLKPTIKEETALSIKLDKLPNVDPADKNNFNYAFKFFFSEKIKGRMVELSQKKYLVLKASDILNNPQPVEVGLIDKNGEVMAGEMIVNPKEGIYKIPLSTFKPSSYLVIPRPYPEYQAYKVQQDTQPFDWSALEMLQLMIKPGKQNNVNMNIEKIWLE